MAAAAHSETAALGRVWRSARCAEVRDQARLALPPEAEGGFSEAARVRRFLQW